VVAIGPTTDGAARACGLVVTHVAEVHSVEGLVAAVLVGLAPS
jgi:uroporphyrinogen-III synthase